MRLANMNYLFATMKEAEVRIGARVSLHNSTFLPKRSQSLPCKIGTICGEPIAGKAKNANRYVPCQLDNGAIENWLIQRLEIVD
jgi:hypothetical protein